MVKYLGVESLSSVNKFKTKVEDLLSTSVKCEYILRPRLSTLSQAERHAPCHLLCLSVNYFFIIFIPVPQLGRNRWGILVLSFLSVCPVTIGLVILAGEKHWP